MRILLFLVCLPPVILADVPDETLILHFQPNSRDIVERLHVRTTSLGKLLITDNGTIVSPLVPSPPLPPLSCVGSSGACAWKSGGEWRKTNISRTEKIFIEVSEANTASICNYKCCGCEWGCRILTIDGCYCPDGFLLDNDKKSCVPANVYSDKLTTEIGNTGHIGILHGYGNNLNRRWLIKASRGSVIDMGFEWIETENKYDFVKVYEPGNKLLFEYAGNTYSRQLRSSHHVILVEFTSDGSNGGRGFSAYHKQIQLLPDISALQLNKAEGYLSTLVTLPYMLCATATYTATSREHLTMFVGSNITGATQLYESHYQQIDKWHIKRFKSSRTWNETGMIGNLTLKLIGQGSKIIRVSLCDASVDEDLYHIGNTTTIPAQKRDISVSPENARESQMCFSGGVFQPSRGACVCPSGFMGTHCEEGCGPNRFGNDCGGICSAFGGNCQNMLFCKTDLPCFCAPGFKGDACDVLCGNHSNEYGVNCTNKCGECLNKNCDPFTGICGDGCKDGYYPPLCQETHTRIAAAPSISQVGWNNASVSINFSNLIGGGTPEFYQVILQELPSNQRIEMKWELVTNGSVTTKIEGLKAGTRYKVKVIIINEDGESYQGGLIPQSEFTTTCSVPDSKQYLLKATSIEATSFNISWKYETLHPYWCPITGFEVSLHHWWQIIHRRLNSHDNSELFTDLLPGTTYCVLVRAVTGNGLAPYSQRLTVTTAGQAPGLVRKLKVNRNIRHLHISWKAPTSAAGNITGYKVVYQCKKLLACSLPCDDLKGEKEINGRSAGISNLMPHAQYLIGVAGISAIVGPYSYVHAITNQTVPDVTPLPSKQPIVAKSNTSFTVQWMPPNCSGLNGYLEGYFYELIEVHPSEQRVLQSGTTSVTQATFHSLEPYTNFAVNIHVQNMVGKNMTTKLTIPVTTAASVPEAVQNVTIYKVGRRMIGIRWAPPDQPSGTLKSFTLSYKKKGSQQYKRETVAIKPCPGWPSMHCHTITTLQPDTHYIISVLARNMETDSDGQAVEITAVTREGAPGTPTDLRVTKVTSESFFLEWKLPYIFNGILRSFLINVEHTDSVDITDCCEYFPVQELPVHEEAPLYSLEVSGLRPAATYTVSVSAKTLTMGPAVNVTYNTPPSVPNDISPPEVMVTEGGLCKVKLSPYKIPPGLNGTYLLVILPHEDYPEPEIFDRGLAELLKETISEEFYLVAEFSPDEMQEGKELEIGTGASVPRKGKVGVLQDPKLPQEFDAGLALVLDYSGAKSVGFASARSLIVEIPQ